MGELSLINYVISCSLKWLGQSSDASGDGAAPDGQHIPQQRVEMLQAGLGNISVHSRVAEKEKNQEHSAYVLQDGHRP